MPNLARTPPQRVSPLPRSPAPTHTAELTAEKEAGPSSPTPPASSTRPATSPHVSQHANDRQSAGNESLPSVASPARVFAPRNPGVMRSPPAGSQVQGASLQQVDGSRMQQDAVPIGVPDIEVQEASMVDIEIEAGESIDQAAGEQAPAAEPSTGDKRKRADDEAFIEKQAQAGLSTDPAGIAVATPPTRSPLAPEHSSTIVPPSGSSPSSGPSRPTDSIPHEKEIARPPTTPGHTSRRRSTRTTAEAAEAASIINAPIETLEGGDDVNTAEYGRRYAQTMKTLEKASVSAAQGWSRKDFEQCFPLLTAKHPQRTKEVWRDTQKAMQDVVLIQARQCFEAQDTGVAVKLLHEAVEEAKEHKRNRGGRRSDAWRPDLTPHGITAAANMTVYDEAYAKLRAEYMGLHADCTTRLASMISKQAELAAFELGVSDGVVELEKSLDVLKPTSEMKGWAENKMGEMHGVAIH